MFNLLSGWVSNLIQVFKEFLGSMTIYISSVHMKLRSWGLLYYISLLFNIRLFLYLISLKFLSQQISISRKIRIVGNEHSLIKD